MQCIENQIQKNLKNWTRFAKSKIKNDGEDFVHDLIERFLTDERFEEIACRGDELNYYAIRAIQYGSMDKRDLILPAIDLEDKEPEIDEHELSFMVSRAKLDLAMKSMAAGDRAMIEWELYGEGSLRYLSEQIDVEYMFLREKMKRAKTKLKQLVK